jgi:hypothetical protein
MQYLCLFYGSNNAMYTNYCIFQEDYSDPNPANYLKAARPPCRSFCVQVILLTLFSFISIFTQWKIFYTGTSHQVATVCANSADFVLTCNEIKCPPTEDQCTPGKIILFSYLLLEAKKSRYLTSKKYLNNSPNEY